MGRQVKVLSKIPGVIAGATISRQNVANYVDVSFTNAQVLACRAAPLTLVAAPGKALTYREFCGAILVVTTTAGAYTETADNLAVRQTNGSGIILSDTIETTGWVDGTAIKATYARPKLDPIGFLQNKALVLHNTGDGEFGGGNAANTLKVRVFYRDHNLTAFGTLA